MVIDAAIKVHTVLGPGLLESVYETALAMELYKRGLNTERQLPIAVEYEGQMIGTGFRADLLVESLVLVELKSVERMTDVFKKQTLTYLKSGKWRLGYLINFNVSHLRDGITRVVNGLPTTAQTLPPRPPRSPRPPRETPSRDDRS
ncbi:MAG: GxxExxY protein [Phycisphaeraceae bacterium]